MSEKKLQFDIKKIFSRVNATTIVFTLLAFIIGWQLGHFDLNLQWKNYTPLLNVKNQQPPTEKQAIDFKLFWDTWDLLSQEYVDKKALDPQKMYYGAVQGMVAAVGDPYTVFLPPEAQKSAKEELGGSFEGVGIQLGYNKDKRLVVISPLQNTPADKAGIKAGDLILKIDNKDTSNMTLPDAVNLIRGQRGTKVVLEIFHDGQDKTQTIELQRETILVKSVEYSQKDTPNGKKIAYIKLSRFGDRTAEEWSKAVSDALAIAPDGVVLDLRNNPGGYLEGAVFIGSEFVDSGNIVLQEDSKGNRKEYKVNRSGKLLKQPILVLINKGSASASEIVAGALRDHNRAKLVGEKSFGKGTIQEAQDLAGGTGIHVTTAKWLTPNGTWVHDKGLEPDIVVAVGDDAGVDNQLNEALKLFDKGF